MTKKFSGIPVSVIQSIHDKALSEVGTRQCIQRMCKLLRAEYPNKDIYPQKVRYWVSQLGKRFSRPQGRAKETAQRRSQSVELSRLRSEVKELSDSLNSTEAILDAVEKSAGRLPPLGEMKLTITEGKKMTIEVLMSDIQFGKLLSDYDSEVAKRRVEEYGKQVQQFVVSKIREGFEVERIILGILGDIIESDKKHGYQSTRACDKATSEQMVDAINSIYGHVIMPLSVFRIPLDVVCIAGNHDHDGHGLVQFMTGRTQLSYTIYAMLEQFSQKQEAYWVNYIIPEGVFHVDDIYGFKVCYEHGVGVGASPVALGKRRAERSAQIKDFITYFRMGDKHHIARFNNDCLIVNGAFFGDDRKGVEYSGINGYDGYPAQLVFAHVPRENNRQTSMESNISIQLGHIA